VTHSDGPPLQPVLPDSRADSTALSALAEAVGDRYLLRGTEHTSRYEHDIRGLHHGRALAVVQPGATAEVAEVVRICQRFRIPVVPQGGHTGYCGAATPSALGNELVLSLERMNRVLALDVTGGTMTLEAGVILADAQAAAARHGLLFPLSMGSQGSCQVGGNLSTNAGGLTVLRYGMSRDLVLGLEVVLPNGQVLNELKTLRKDNTGYDLKQLFLGAEGTLGVITRAVLRLFARAERRVTVWAVLPDLAALGSLKRELEEGCANNLTSFEFMAAEALACVSAAGLCARLPAGDAAAPQVLLEWVLPVGQDAEDAAMQVLSPALAAGRLSDVILATSEAQRDAFWQVREAIPAAERALGGSVKHDVSLPLAQLPGFVVDTSAALRARYPGVRLSVYGHVGDGNVHLNVIPPEGEDAGAFIENDGPRVSDFIHSDACRLGGSFSAEHGVGVLKRDLLQRHADPVALELMQSIKRTLDPKGLMNPGRVL
jgi:FAD/FMN-containing dehydrogenase